MSVDNKHIGGDASVGRNATMGGNASVRGSVHIGHNLRVDGWIEGKDIKAANKGLFLNESELNKAYPNPHDGWFAGVGSSSPFIVYIARDGGWVRTNGTFAVDVDMSQYNGRIEALEGQLESNNALIAELIEIIREGGGSADLVMITVENDNPTWGSVSGGGLKQKGSVTVTATAESGYHFVEWQDAEGNTIAGAGATYTFDATESVTLKAVFAMSYFTVTVGTDQTTLGDVSKSPSDATDGYIYNEEVTLTATPKQTVATAYFVRWEDAQGVVKSTSASYTFKVTENVTLKAVFAEVAVIDRGIDSGSTGTGTITATVTRGGVDVAETDVRIGDHVLITLTGTSKKPSSLTVGGVEVQCTPAQDNKVWTYEFDYSGSESLVFRATFEGDAIVVTYEVRVQSNNANQGSVHIEYPVGTPVSGDKVNLEESEQIKLVATGAANTDYVFDKWMKNGTEEVTITDGLLTVSPSTAGLYVATFRHSEEPDFYFGVVNTPTGSSHAADAADLEEHITGGYLADNPKANMQMPNGKTFVILYDETRVLPASYKITTDFGDDTGTDFDNARKFYTGTRVVNNISYTTIELVGGSESDNPMPVEITFTDNSN